MGLSFELINQGQNLSVRAVRPWCVGGFNAESRSRSPAFGMLPREAKLDRLQVRLHLHADRLRVPVLVEDGLALRVEERLVVVPLTEGVEDGDVSSLALGDGYLNSSYKLVIT
jgi:hypothetical protein